MNPNAKVTIDQMVFRNLYYRYQTFTVPLITIVICVLVLWLVVVPQAESFFAQKDALTTNTQDVATLHQNLATLTNMNDTNLNQLLSVATNALPTDKDFAGIITSIQNAAAVSGAVLGDYSFQLGTLNGVDQSGQTSQTPVQLAISLKGDMASAQRFATQIKKQLPLANPIAIGVSNNNSISITVIFYYAIASKITFDPTQQLPILGNSDTELLQSLANSSNLQEALLSGNATTTATLSPSPTVVPTVLVSPTVAVSSGSATVSAK